MLQAQGLPPANPYRTLQLHPSAPRELVVDAYWTLVARYKRTLTHPGEAAAGVPLGELNRAYSTLMDDDRRREFDQENGFSAARAPAIDVRRRAVGVLGFGSSIVATSDHIDHYHLLQVDREADSEMIDVAYTVLARKAIGYNIEDVFLRDLLDEAHRTLRDPQLRAQYDASLSKNGKHRPVANGSAPALAVVPPLAEDETSQPSSSDVPAELAVTAAAVAAQNGQHGAGTTHKRGFLRRQKKAPPVAATVAAASVIAVTADRDDVNAAEHARLLTLRDVEHAELPEPPVHPDFGAEQPSPSWNSSAVPALARA